MAVNRNGKYWQPRENICPDMVLNYCGPWSSVVSYGLHGIFHADHGDRSIFAKHLAKEMPTRVGDIHSPVDYIARAVC